MKNYLNKSTFKGIKGELTVKYGVNKSDEIWKYANSEYHKLETDEPDADKTSRSYVFPAVSIYRAIERYAPGEALGTTRSYGTKTGLKLKKMFGRITSLPGMPALMWKNMDKIAAKMSSGYDVKNLRVEKDKCMPSKIKRHLEETEMKYGFMAMAMPLVLDKTVYIFLQDYGIEVTSLLKKKIRKEYREIVERTPALDKGNSLKSTLYIGCYLVAFHKAAPDVIDEKCFEGLIRCLCDEMMRREKENDSAFSEKNIKSREEAAKRSQTSVCEMDWKSTFRRIDKDNYEFTYSKCGLCELGKREGCFYLIKYLCMTDYISFDKGGAKLIRNHTLANGDEYCDFHVSRKEK